MVGQEPPWRLFRAIIEISKGQSVRRSRWQGSLRLGRWCRGEGRGPEPDVTFPENRHVRSLGLSGAPSLAHQPERSHGALTSHSAVAPGGDPGPAWDPGLGFEEAGEVGLRWPVLSPWGKLRLRPQQKVLQSPMGQGSTRGTRRDDSVCDSGPMWEGF